MFLKHTNLVNLILSFVDQYHDLAGIGRIYHLLFHAWGIVRLCVVTAVVTWEDVVMKQDSNRFDRENSFDSKISIRDCYYAV